MSGSRDTAPSLDAFAQSIVETVRQPLLILDPQLQVCAANPAFHAAFGVPMGKAVGRPLAELGQGRLAVSGLLALLSHVVSTGEAFDGYEVSHDFPGLGRKELLLNARRVYARDDPAPMVLLSVEDATEARQARNALWQLNADLEQRVRDRTAQLEAANREMEAFCYSVSHDLRAPLRAIDGFARELLDRYADKFDESAGHYLRRMRANSQRMADLIDDLLQLSQLSRTEMAVTLVDLTALAREVVAELQLREPERQVTLVVQPGMTARADARLLRLALANLLDNAWKFTSKKLQATVEVGWVARDRGSEYFVRDDGAGFDPRYAGKLFGAFQRLHHERDFPGTGVGLAIVQRVIHRHGGTVRGESVLGEWARFSFTLEGGGS